MDWKKFVKGSTTSHTINKENDDPTRDLESLDDFVENQSSIERISNDFYIYEESLIHKSSNKKYFNTAEFRHYINKHSNSENPVMFIDRIEQGKKEIRMLSSWTPITNGLMIIDSLNVHFISLGKRMTLEIMPIHKITSVETDINILKLFVGNRHLSFKTSVKKAKLIKKHIQNIKVL